MIVATNLYNFLFVLPIMKERKSVLELRTNPVFTEDHQLLRLRTRCLIVNQLSTPFFLGRDVFKNSKVMESIRPKGLYIHCHGKRHKIPFIEEKEAIGMTGKLQPSIKAIEMEINDNHLYTLTSYKLEPGERRTVEVKINEQCEHNYPDGTIIQVEQGKLSANFKTIPCINELQQGRTEIMIECNAFTTTFIPSNTLAGEISGTDTEFDYTQTFHLTNRPDTKEEEEMLTKYLQWKEAEEELSCEMEINEADLTTPTTTTSHPNLQEYAAVTSKEPIPTNSISSKRREHSQTNSYWKNSN